MGTSYVITVSEDVKVIMGCTYLLDNVLYLFSVM